MEALIPWLYLKGVSTGDFSEALSVLSGPDASGLPLSTGIVHTKCKSNQATYPSNAKKGGVTMFEIRKSYCGLCHPR
jgi:hypothetical protein